MNKEKRIKKIIEEATVDAYNEWEELAGWDAILTDNIKAPQTCTINGMLAALISIDSSGKAVYAKVKLDDAAKAIRVPIEDISIMDKKQDVYIRAYEEGFANNL